MTKKKSKDRQGTRQMAADPRLERETAFQLLSAELSAQCLKPHTDEHRRRLRELVEKGHSLRGIARNLPGSPDESTLRAFLNSGPRRVVKAKQISQTKKESATIPGPRTSPKIEPPNPTSFDSTGQLNGPQQTLSTSTAVPGEIFF